MPKNYYNTTKGARTMHIQVLTTVSSRKDAERIASILVDKNAAACAQIVGPIKSVYRWKGKVEHAREWMCIAKTTKKGYVKLERLLKEIHPYELAEIIAIPILAGSKEYLAWITKETSL
jgi:periplasmic divalent cation tolerance protein